jgi:hypothetical protein
VIATVPLLGKPVLERPLAARAVAVAGVVFGWGRRRPETGWVRRRARIAAWARVSGEGRDASGLRTLVAWRRKWSPPVRQFDFGSGAIRGWLSLNVRMCVRPTASPRDWHAWGA